MADQSASIVRVDLDVGDRHHFDETMIGMTNALKDWRPAFGLLADRFLEHMGEVWNSEGGATKYGQWSPLTKRYAAWKNKHYPGQRILQLTGAMEKAMTQRGGDHVEDITADKLEVGGKGRYFEWHQTGTRWMDPRSPIAFPDSEVARWLQIIREYLSWERFARGRRA